MAVVREQTKEEVATAFRVYPRTVVEWAKNGCPASRKGSGPKAPYLFNVDEIRIWLRATGRSGKPGRPSIIAAPNSDIARAQQLYLEERALSVRLERERRAGRLHDAVECQARQIMKIQAVKTALLGLPRAAAAELANLAAPEIETKLRARVLAILADFSGDIHTAPAPVLQR